MPILGQINSYELKNTFIAVVRYFGGTKLGVGGLISAYKKAASLAIENNTIIEVSPTLKLSAKVGYNQLGNVLSIIDRNQLTSSQEHHNDNCKVTIESKLEDLERIKELFNPLHIRLVEV